MEILAFTFWTAFLVLNMIGLTLNFNHFRTERVYHSDKIAYLVMVFLAAVLIITSVVILTFQLSELNDSTKDCVVCWLESYRRDVYVGYIDERTEIR